MSATPSFRATPPRPPLVPGHPEAGGAGDGATDGAGGGAADGAGGGAADGATGESGSGGTWEVPLRKGGHEPVAEQIAAHFAAAIGAGDLAPGERLPTIREVAARTGVTRAVVQSGYRLLQQRGLVQATVGRGTVVAEPQATLAQPFSVAALDALQQLRSLAEPPLLPAGQPLVADFAELLPDQTSFPVDAFAASLDAALRRSGGACLGYGRPMGDPRLRQQLAERSGCSADEVLVTNGAQQGIDLVLRTFAAAGDAVAAAVPTYHHLFGLLKAQGLALAPVPLVRPAGVGNGSANGGGGGGGGSGSGSANGGRIDLDALEQVLRAPRVRLLYVMPSFHNPTGRTLDAEQRQALMRVVARTGVPLLEDEFLHDLRFAGEAPPSLRSHDERGLTVTVRTFSKGLFPGVRVGWVVARPDVLAPMAALKHYADLETSPLLQAALADFLQRGQVDQHLDDVRNELRERHEAAREALRAHMPAGTSWTEPDGGFALWLELQGGVEPQRLAAAAAARGVLVTPGFVFDPAGRASGVRISLARASVDQVRAGIRVLAECTSELLAAADRTAHRRLFL